MKISFAGGGKMAEAMIAAMISSRKVVSHEIFACDVDPRRRDLLKKKYGINVYSSNRIAVADSDIVFLAVKPQVLLDVLGEIAGDVTKKHIVVSIAAGKKIASIEGVLEGAKVVRVMPNIACLAGEGMSVYCGGSRVSRRDKDIVAELLGCFGRVLELKEDMFDAVTAISGSGPAFFAHLALCMVDAGAAEGLEREDAMLLVQQTMLGTSRLLLEKGMAPEELIKAVTSAKGTTEAGLKVLQKPSVASAISRTVKAAAGRSRQLSS